MLYILLALPLLTGLACALCRLGERKEHGYILISLQALITGLAVYACLTKNTFVTPVWHMTDTLTFSLWLDSVGCVFIPVVTLSWLVTLPYAGVYMAHSAHKPRFYAFLFLTEFAMLGTALSADFITLYLFYELTTLASFPLVLHDLKRSALLGAGKYLYYSIGGAFVALFGLVIFCANDVSLGFTSGGSVTETTPLLLTAALCVIVGFGAKAGMYPLHNWLPAAHPAAPAPASGLLSGVIAKAGVIGIVRVLYFVVGADALRGTWVQWTCLILSLLTVAMGSFLGCMENGLKKRLAYSSISQISYILVGLFLLTSDGAVGALLQLVFHAAAKVGIFLCAGAIIHLIDVETVDCLRGIGKRLPMTMLAFTLLSLSLVGIPPFGGFWSKWYLGTAALEALPGALAYVAPAVLILSALLTAGYLFAPVISAFFPGKNIQGLTLSSVREPKAMLLPLFILSVVCLILGALSGPLTRFLTGVAAALGI